MVTRRTFNMVILMLFMMLLADYANPAVGVKQCKTRITHTTHRQQEISVTPQSIAENVDACLQGNHDCGIDAVCTDSGYGFHCTCKEGFRGDGYTCNKICEGRNFGVGSQCFFLSRSYDKKSFPEAVEACRDLGGVLAEPRDIVQLISTIKSERNVDKVMLGYSDAGAEGEWVGLSGLPFTHDSHWIPGEPNSWEGRDEDCVEIKMEFEGLNDSECHESVNYLCEV